MGDWAILSVLGADEKWSSMPPYLQFLSSIGAHSIVFASLACVVSATSYKAVVPEATSLSVDFVIESNNLDGTSFLHSDKSRTAKAIPIKSAPSDLSAVSSLIAVDSALPQQSTVRAALVSAVDNAATPFQDPGPAYVLTGDVPDPLSSKLKPGKNSAAVKNLKDVSPVKIAFSSFASKGTKTSRAEQAKKYAISSMNSSKVIQSSLDDSLPAHIGFNDIASAITQASTFLLPKSSFSELDTKACQTFMEGESLQSADLEKANERFRKAIALMDQAIPLLVAESGAESRQMAEALQNVGRCYDKLKDYNRSEEYYLKSSKMQEKVSGEKSLGRGISLVYLADALIEQKKYKAAEEALLTSLPIYEQQYGANSKYVAWTYQRLNKICAFTERSEEAEKWRTKAEQIAER